MVELLWVVVGLLPEHLVHQYMPEVGRFQPISGKWLRPQTQIHNSKISWLPTINGNTHTMLWIQILMAICLQGGNLELQLLVRNTLSTIVIARHHGQTLGSRNR